MNTDPQLDSAATVLLRWAWAKVNLHQLQKRGAPEAEIVAAIKEHKAALRAKRKMDAEEETLTP